MLYSIQNSGGEVYGMFPMPHSAQSAEVWAAELSDELKDILDINGVKSDRLVLDDGVKEDHLIIDIDPINEEQRLARVHETIGRLARRHSY